MQSVLPIAADFGPAALPVKRLYDHMLKLKPSLHLEILDVIAYGDVSLRRQAADFLFSQWPPENDLTNRQGILFDLASSDAQE